MLMPWLQLLRKVDTSSGLFIRPSGILLFEWIFSSVMSSVLRIGLFHQFGVEDFEQVLVAFWLSSNFFRLGDTAYSFSIYAFIFST